jgi:hypothetical protein
MSKKQLGLQALLILPDHRLRGRDLREFGQEGWMIVLCSRLQHLKSRTEDSGIALGEKSVQCCP